MPPGVGAPSGGGRMTFVFRWMLKTKDKYADLMTKSRWSFFRTLGTELRTYNMVELGATMIVKAGLDLGLTLACAVPIYLRYFDDIWAYLKRVDQLRDVLEEYDDWMREKEKEKDVSVHLFRAFLSWLAADLVLILPPFCIAANLTTLTLALRHHKAPARFIRRRFPSLNDF
uniref:Uncharacterized protein n=1 Tax=Chromera velia CCMP2878 TaxID=1169474 RepID=A0A0G4I240_9ALVE|eukprot:Cvel_10236.t1-p1 / transcript=Cvel_10236.t1 / gene=Cvel_10236 / organism=Chromera_velia_CCMP2878 / gene_product=hypothetical protein / transcript_product=hypothetical protein / location=Cvel_scaffold613:23373-26166(-) / protein_length=171 / sequence_SO=supercontig / SO=protein_coding / is_pseudo=false